MSFLNPWFAAAVAAVVVPALLILYFLKLRRREQLVPSTLLWKRAVQDLQVNAPFQRLRRNLLLFLQLLILAAAVVALARPIVQTTVADADRVVILIDRSASMNAREDDDTRLEQAKEQAVRLVRTLNRRAGGWWSLFSLSDSRPQTQAMVIAFSDRASIVSPFTTNTSELVELIRAIEATDGRTDLREALDLAEAYMAPPTRLSPDMESTPVSAESPSKLVLISDGKVANLDRLTLRSGTLELIRIGAARDNVGITALRTQRNYERPEDVDVYLAIQNFGPQPVETDCSLYVDGALRSVQTLKLGAHVAPADPGEGAQPAPASQEATLGDRRSLPLRLTLDRAALLEARLARADALSVDNVACAAVPPPRRQRVLVVTEGNVYLHSALAGLPLQEYPFVTPAQYESGDGGPFAADGQSLYDVVIFDKYAPASAPAGNYLFLGAVPKLDALEVGETIENHALIWWNETHPVLRHAALDYVYVAQSQVVKVPGDAEVLVEGPRGPAMFRYASSGRQYLVVTFAIEKSTWWNKLSFVVFMYNALRYLGGGDAETDRGPIHPGDTLRVSFPADRKELRLYRPDSSSVTLTPDAFGVAYFGGTERAGVYRADGGIAGRDRFAVNLEDDWESDIAPPQTALKTGTGVQIREAAAIQTATPEVWRWFVGTALVLVLFEWWVYNRRVMI